MRLYSKLLVMILLAGALQHFAPPSAWGGEAWFTLRCHVANVMGDDALAAQLVEERYDKIHTIDVDVEEVYWELEERSEPELHLAAG